MRAGGIIFFLALGGLAIAIGINGNLGSILGSIIDPANMTNVSPVGG